MKRLTTKQLKNKLDNLTFALALGVCADLVQTEKWQKLADEQEKTQKEFYARRNYKQYLTIKK